MSSYRIWKHSTDDTRYQLYKFRGQKLTLISMAFFFERNYIYYIPLSFINSLTSKLFIYHNRKYTYPISILVVSVWLICETSSLIFSCYEPISQNDLSLFRSSSYVQEQTYDYTFSWNWKYFILGVVVQQSKFFLVEYHFEFLFCFSRHSFLYLSLSESR